MSLSAGSVAAERLVVHSCLGAGQRARGVSGSTLDRMSSSGAVPPRLPLHVPANNVSSEQHCTPPALPRAAGLQVPCSNWTAGANNACPTSCTLTPAGSLTTPAVIDLTGCAACIDGQTGFALTCYRCKPGFVHLYHSFDRQVSRRRLHAFGSRRQPLQWRHCHATV